MAVTLKPIKEGRYELEQEGNTLFLRGNIDSPDSDAFLEKVVKDIHSQVIVEGLKEFRVDLTALKFINSPGISIFAEWITIIEEEPEDKRYILVFTCNIKEHLWQEATISSLEFINPNYVRKEVIV